MANTFSQIYIQLVFAVSGRLNLISSNNRIELEKYIYGIITKKDIKQIAIYCMPDHVHLFISINPEITIADLVRDLKSNSSKFINQKGWINGKFSWQRGYGAFSYSKSQIDIVSKYILNQESHHKIKTFKEEYIELLEKFEIEYNAEYLFDWIE